MPMRHLITISAVLLLAGCGGEGHRKAEPAPAAAVPVQTAPVQESQWAAGYEATGTVRARTSTNISAKVMGYVRQVGVRVGDHVTAGQALITIDARDLDEEFRRAESGVDEARAAMPEVDNAVAAAKAQLDLAGSTFSRIEDLYKKRSVSNQEFDEASARLKAARAAHEMALAKRQQLGAKIAQAERARDAARIMLGYARLTAPFAGVVTARMAEEGALATPGTPLLTIEREGEYRLEAAVEESRANSIKAGNAATVTVEALGRPVAARISEIVPAVDPGSRAYTVKIDLPGSPALRSGMFGRAVFSQGSRRALTVPAAAVVERGQLVSVMVMDGGVARTRLITIGERRGGNVEVLSGLTAGEAVISPLPASLADGARVEVRQ